MSDHLRLRMAPMPVTPRVREHQSDVEPPADLPGNSEQRPVFVLGEHDPGGVLLRELSEPLERIPVEEPGFPARPSTSPPI